MFATTIQSRAKRRGIVLVLVLGMLGLMALIGVTFATFAGQSMINSRNFSQGVSRPQAEALMDYALAQLINDTNNPLSAIRGHSLLRDMYGNDSVFANGNAAANPAVETGGLLSTVYTNANGTQLLYLSSPVLRGSKNSPSFNAGVPTPFGNQLQYATNIPTGGQYYGLNFTRWIIRFQNVNNVAGYVPQTFEILEDDTVNGGGVHLFTLASNLGVPTSDQSQAGTPATSSDWTSFIYANPNAGPTVTASSSTPPTYTFAKGYTQLASELNTSAPFVLDGRYMRAFNGPGLTKPDTVTGLYPYNVAALANFRVANALITGGLDPNAVGMDEDYDACDLENWFLAIQSADGQVVIPSFHRPSILTGPNSPLPKGAVDDWHVNSPANNANGPWGNPKILRPRVADNSPLFPPDPSFPDSNGKLTYDIDNDGDGVTDSVWVDLGYPVQRDPTTNKLYKPLFAFMVLGLNGRLPLNTVGNLQARAIGDQTNKADANGNTLLGSSGQVPYPGPNTDSTGINIPVFRQTWSSQTFLDAPTWDHASHLGYSVNEINPKFALQNAPSNLYPSPNGSPTNTIPGIISPNAIGGLPNYTGNYATSSYSQYDNVGVSVALTQMRNILAGTVPTDVQNPIAVSNLANLAGLGKTNQDLNFLMVNGLPYILPNNMADSGDIIGANGVQRTPAAVPGRWGESQGVPQLLPAPSTSPVYSNLSYPPYWYSNPVRAGRSYYTGGTNDVMDDDFDSMDPMLSGGVFPTLTYATLYYNMPSITTSLQVAIGRYYPEQLDNYDGAGQMLIPTERMRRFYTPVDVAGVGRTVAYMQRPHYDYDYGQGFEAGSGRASYFRYYRPAGMPQEVRYPYGGPASTYSAAFFNTNLNPPYFGQRFLMPQIFPVGQISLPSAASRPDVHNNLYHGFQAMLTPDWTTAVNSDVIAVMGAMPYDWDPFQPKTNPQTVVTDPFNATGDVPGGYPTINTAKITLYSPMINPYSTFNSFNVALNQYNVASMSTNLYLPNPLFTSVNSSNGPNLGPRGNLSASGGYPIPYAGYGTNNEPYSTTTGAPGAQVVNGYLGSSFYNPTTKLTYSGDGSLNVDEADEMNLYVTSRYDMPYGPSDLEWLYRLQDVDGATLNSRLSKLAPISFLNPADGLTHRRLFSTDSWELNSIVYANDNPQQYAGLGVGTGYTTDIDFTYNSRFTPIASPSLAAMNQVNVASYANPYANWVATEFLPNPTFQAPIVAPRAVDPTQTTSLGKVQTNAVTNAGAVLTPTLAHRDRKINLNHPLPISNDPAEPIRQKWCRETYQLLKAILPPASLDTPEELAALSQFVVNIVDFRDPDCTMTRFVNTDLEVTDARTYGTTDATYTTPTDPTNPVDPTVTTAPFPIDPRWEVSTTGVRFATDVVPSPHFPYDPSIYSPDTQTKFLVQHGMEYSPVAINEVLAYQTEYFDTNLGGLANNRRLFVELVNRLHADQNSGNPSSNTPGGASDVPLNGWDLVVTPDAFGWGRPDPITGEVSMIAWPPLLPIAPTLPAPTTPPVTIGVPATTGNPPTQTVPPPTGSNQRPLLNTMAPLSYVGWAALPNKSIPAIGNGTTTTPGANYFLVANQNAFQNAPYNLNTPTAGTSSVDAENNPMTVGSGTNNFDATVPDTILPTSSAMTASPLNQTLPQGAGNAMMFWVYLRRPANPFDTAALTPERPNREMVVVDATRFIFTEGGGVLAGTPAANSTPSATVGVNKLYSIQRLQWDRGGHLVPTSTPVSTLLGNSAPGINGNTIFQQRPASAYGYSEQSEPGSNDSGNYPIYKVDTTSGNYPAKGDTTTMNKPLGTHFLHTLGHATTGRTSDTVKSNIPFNDRDFTSVAELLLVPGCPPGLFTKQFVEESYPGNVAQLTVSGTGPNFTYNYTYATGYDDSSSIFTAKNVKAPSAPNVGRKDFPNQYATVLQTPITVPGTPITPPQPPIPSFPYLPDNFYYTGASVAPPAAKANASYTNLTTEIGGWTGGGWFKMFEFLDVPSSANGSIGTADGFNGTNAANYDWARADLKPGLLNLNLIIDEEVFAGLFDDPRLNESLASSSTILNASSTIPYLVTQIDAYGYPASDANGNLYGQQPIFPLTSQTVNNGPLGVQQPLLPLGRGYVYRDPNIGNYDPTLAPTYNYQQVHGMKAAFSDFLKLRHGGSGFILANGAGTVGSGPFLPLGTQVVQPTTAVAAERPFRSLSYPDINYTVMRPASLPPSPLTSVYNPSTGTTSSNATITTNLQNLFAYSVSSNDVFPWVQLNPSVAPMNVGWPTPAGFPYIDDPGIKNPYLPIQYVNQAAPVSLSPPYESPTPVGTASQAPFPPPIPPVPARRLFQIPDAYDNVASTPPFSTSGASLQGQQDPFVVYPGQVEPTNPQPQIVSEYTQPFPINQPTIAPQLSTLAIAGVAPPSLVDSQRFAFNPDNYTPGLLVNNYLGAAPGGNSSATAATDFRQHPLYRTEWLQKVMNLTTVRTHQFAVWITVGFFEVVRPGTPELGIPDYLGQEVGITAGRNVRYRSFFTLDRTKATGFNPYYPGDFRNVVTYRRRIE